MEEKSERIVSTGKKHGTKSFFSSWEFALAIIFIAVSVFCRAISPNYTPGNVLREMPKYLGEMFLLFPMAFILLMGDIDISVGSIVCLSATVSCFARRCQPHCLCSNPAGHCGTSRESRQSS